MTIRFDQSASYEIAENDVTFAKFEGLDLLW